MSQAKSWGIGFSDIVRALGMAERIALQVDCERSGIYHENEGGERGMEMRQSGSTTFQSGASR